MRRDPGQQPTLLNANGPRALYVGARGPRAVRETARAGPVHDHAREDAERTARSLTALAAPARLRLLSILTAHEGGEACVCDLVEPLGLAQPTVSHHLKVLTEAGFVTREKRGVWAHYTLVPAALRDLTAHLGTHLLHADGA